MRYDNESNTVLLSVTELSEYAFRRENPTVLSEKYGFVRKSVTPDEPDYPEDNSADPIERGREYHSSAETDIMSASGSDFTRTEVPLGKRIMYGEYSLSVNGYADIISFDGASHTVEEIKTVSYFPAGLSAFTNAEYFAQAAVYAYLFAEESELSEVNVRITYIKRKNGERVSFSAPIKRITLTRMFESLLSRAYVIINAFYERHRVFPGEAKKLPFPYTSIRDGQLEFVNAEYRCIRRGENLLVSAPTGIGKTMSALFPAIKAVGAGLCDKIFYLTAKTVTGRAALDAMKRISKYAPHCRSLMICAREMMCPFNKNESVAGCGQCERISSVSEDFGRTSVSYRERELDALEELLCGSERVFTTDIIGKVAGEHSVCPYELAMDLSESCTVVVCDYNYVTDDNVRFRRYFKNQKSDERYVFLIDEAHNLPDRTRNTYSASISGDLCEKLSDIAEKYYPDESELVSDIDELNRVMADIRAMCTDGEYVKNVGENEISCGFYESGRIPDSLVRVSGNLSRVLMRLMREGEDGKELLEKYYRILNRVVFVSSYFDEKFRFFAARENEGVTAELLCLDPSGVLGAMLSAAKCTVLFSATLSPIEYFAEVVGMEDAVRLELESPYERDNLCLVAFDSVSTRLSDRKQTASDCAEIIAETVRAKAGNYIAYFPSYDYMRCVCRIFAGIMPECGIVMQTKSMSYRERERFLSLFHDRSRGPVIGFCVLGGMFSEGIDLAGESLIGAIIVGTGMPQLSAERNIMASYYDEKNERGQDFAYLCPGISKVLQAAGRVIRSESDRGVIVWIDDRLGDGRIRLMLPPHWRHIRYTGDTASLSAILGGFWNEEK